MTDTLFADGTKKDKSTKIASKVILCVPWLSYELSTFSNNFTPFFFSTLKERNKSLSRNKKIRGKLL